MSSPSPAQRTLDIQPFQAMEVFKQALARQAAGADIISLGIGEPDFTAPEPVLDALMRAARDGRSGYTPTLGIPALREAIARYYGEQLGAPVDPARVVVTQGASGALLLAALTLINPGDEILMPDPCYPANRNFISSAGGVSRLIPCHASERYQLSAASVAANWGPKTRGILVASPSNPTGTSIPRPALAELLEAVRTRGGLSIVDEIYLGLSYEAAPRSALSLDDDLIILNSFSKYFHMTGWRLGWMIVPQPLVAVVEKLASNLMICPPALSQYAALACFEPASLEIFEARREIFKARRDFLLPAFERLGLRVDARPDGAFYIFADISAHASDSAAFSRRLLDEAGIAAVPGHDFGPTHGARAMRFSYATATEKLEEAVARIGTMLGR
ncbi:pyridoxal phosphate-dependent aminotransferase [Kerstersia gyiorum]|uniref:Aminotransferase n=1 Tax=Kerstersia gyiorum TaxID=206506 RepID=A0A171KW38_9BURK|nr:pyridoxal phosphate-dependent aminotransferase [Kerstersia gyiorum]MCO7635635.1 pyridoxal phosphate-dependent aminotransferase [Pseudomonas sp. S 311-6]KAB0545107.1 pyridoxal phosphate-dependent aminotransferase [Kerstersia gyiorum]KKO73105.1 aminotransferase [Kerstersia gyiorum]MCP1632379.1 aspartate/methionine/tyrosine aminotransferase [Kerstersia gyiorum]MCP1635114.1 aspartate/methionine/tyrosine aminotransferase [Kerstersia gyiorum]